MRFFLNNPPRWLARALAVVNGKTQTEIENTLFPVVEVVQRGWGLTPSITSRQVDGDLVNPTITTIACTHDEAARIQVQHNNPGTAACVLTITLRVGTGVSVQQQAISTAAGANSAWDVLGRGRQWFVIPPGCSMEISQAAYAVTAGFVRIIEVRSAGGIDLS